MDEKNVTLLSPSLFRSLQVLGYPVAQDNASGRCELTPQQCKELILWLEETKIRLLPPQHRMGLRMISPSDTEKWCTHFLKYTQSLNLNVPPTFDWFDVNQRQSILSHLIMLAIQDEYLDACERKQVQCCDNAATANATEKISEDLIIDDETHSKLNALLHHYKLPEVFSKETLTLKALASILQAIKESSNGVSEETIDSATFRSVLERVSTACASDLPQVKQTAACLRALHVENLERLQTLINTTLAELQSITGNPKTHKRVQ